MNKVRIGYFDIIAGILILGMLFSHCSWFEPFPVQETLLWKVYKYSLIAVVVPWFFFKSGMFYSDNKTLKEELLGGAKKLLIPYCIFSVIGLLFHSIDLLSIKEYSINEHLLLPLKSVLACGFPTGNLPLWFILCLFAVRIGYKILNSVCKIHPLLIALGCLLLAYIFYLNKIIVPYYLNNTLIALLYFSAGVFFRERQYNDIVFASSLLLFIIIEVFDYSFLDVWHNSLHGNHYLVAPFMSLSGIILLNNIFKRVPSHYALKCFPLVISGVLVYSYLAKEIPHSYSGVLLGVLFSSFIIVMIMDSCGFIIDKGSLIKKIGRDTMILLVCHWPLFSLSNIVYRVLGVDDPWFEFAVRIITLVLLLPICVRLLEKPKFSWMIGKI